MSYLFYILVSHTFIYIYFYNIVFNAFLSFSCSVTCCRKHRERKCDVLIQKSTETTAKKNEEELVVKRRKIDIVESTVPEEKLEQLSKFVYLLSMGICLR